MPALGLATLSTPRARARPLRLRQAHAATKRDALIHGTAAARSAAAAAAAAARELRPVDIVGVYEAQREAAEAELAILRQEVGAMVVADALGRARVTRPWTWYGVGLFRLHV